MLTKISSIFHTINLKNTLSSATFSAEGSAVVVGTNHGKVMVVDLRALDKAPKCVDVEGGGKILWLFAKVKVSLTSESPSLTS